MSLLQKPAKRPCFAPFNGTDAKLEGKQVELIGQQIFLNDVELISTLNSINVAIQELKIEKAAELPSLKEKTRGETDKAVEMVKDILQRKERICLLQQELKELENRQYSARKVLLEMIQ